MENRIRKGTPIKKDMSFDFNVFTIYVNKIVKLNTIFQHPKTP